MIPSSNNRTDRARGDKQRGTRNIHTIEPRDRIYLAGVESLVHEARLSDDPRVVVTALRVLGCQGAAVRQLLGSAFPDPDREPFNITPEEMANEWEERP
jgi:hypothetical protein